VTEIADIIDAFELLGDWEARYAYLVELGERLDQMPNELRTEENRVKGCMSTVHIAAVADADDSERIRYVGDCDTATIKGVVAILVELLSHKTPQEVVNLDVDQLFTGLNLEEHLSPNRHFGIYAIVQMMKAQAERLRQAA
jgi:cysteine desulfuration protein SufE